jgi:hypothetical protein
MVAANRLDAAIDVVAPEVAPGGELLGARIPDGAAIGYIDSPVPSAATTPAGASRLPRRFMSERYPLYAGCARRRWCRGASGTRFDLERARPTRAPAFVPTPGA